MTKLRPKITTLALFLLLIGFLNQSFAMTKITLPKGEQRSASGIKHSFLVTGPKTCIVNESSEITWQINKASRDGTVLPNGNILIAFAKEVIEYNKDQEIVWTYKLSNANKIIHHACWQALGRQRQGVHDEPRSPIHLPILQGPAR